MKQALSKQASGQGNHHYLVGSELLPHVATITHHLFVWTNNGKLTFIILFQLLIDLISVLGNYKYSIGMNNLQKRMIPNLLSAKNGTKNLFNFMT